MLHRIHIFGVIWEIVNPKFFYTFIVEFAFIRQQKLDKLMAIKECKTGVKSRM